VLDSGITLEDPQFVSLDDGSRFRERCDPKTGDVLICSRGTIGRCCAIEVNEVFCLMGSVILVRAFPQIAPRYLAYYLKSETGQFFIRGATKGMAVNALYLKDIKLCPVPIPPTSEQHRIVAKVDELMALCDQLEQQQTHSIEAHQTLVEALLGTLTRFESQHELSEAWSRIANHFDTLFTTQHSIDQLKQTILQLAVMGKLVAQNPNDEPASVLLERIAKQKERMVEQGKLKKEKALPAIEKNEKPFPLPAGWAWSRLPEIGELARGKSKHRPRNDPRLYSNGTIPMVQTGDVSKADPLVSTYTGLYNQDGLNQSRLWPKGTMCITIAANIAETGILAFDACFPDSVVGFIPFDKNIDVKYFEYFMRTAKSHLEDYAPSTAQKNINLDILGQLLVPLPTARELGASSL
jgi:type I restriction enzyme S subunit